MNYFMLIVFGDLAWRFEDREELARMLGKKYTSEIELRHKVLDEMISLFEFSKRRSVIQIIT